MIYLLNFFLHNRIFSLMFFLNLQELYILSNKLMLNIINHQKNAK